MTLKKMVLLGLTALAALAFAIPAAASAAEITDEGNPIPEAGITETLSLGSETVQFGNAAGGIACEEATAHALVKSGGATILSFTPSECETFGALNTSFNCHIEGNPLSTTPWNAPLVGNNLVIENVQIDNNMQAGCFFGNRIDITGGNVTATPNQLIGVESFTLSGTVETTVGEAEASGVMNLDKPGTFSVQ